tara:strand:- start:1823 stop:2554 length:732 start_codon:yes stop_codon:yes gene_type:complete
VPIHAYRTALVTGAASGIGAACTRMLRQNDLDVLALDRHGERLSAISTETGCDILQMDIRQTDQLYQELTARDFDIVINNAGLAHGLTEGFLGPAPEKVDEMIEVNVGAALHVLRAVLPSMKERNAGHIVEMGSIASQYPLGLPVYSASKGAIHSLSRSMRMELVGTRIRHTEILPGRTVTGFFENSFANDEERNAFISGHRMLGPEDIADAIQYALQSPPHVNVSMIELTPVDQIPGATNWS